MNKECEYNKFSKKEVEKMIDELTGTKFLDAFAILNHLKACEEENTILKQALNEIRGKLKEHKYDLDYEPWAVYKIKGEILFNILQIIDKHMKED